MMMLAAFLQEPSSLFEGATKLLDYGIAGILVLTLLLWFIERRETLKRFERVMKESAAADMDVAKALIAVQTILLTLHDWYKTNDDPKSD